MGAAWQKILHFAHCMHIHTARHAAAPAGPLLSDPYTEEECLKYIGAHNWLLLLVPQSLRRLVSLATSHTNPLPISLPPTPFALVTVYLLPPPPAVPSLGQNTLGSHPFFTPLAPLRRTKQTQLKRQFHQPLSLNSTHHTPLDLPAVSTFEGQIARSSPARVPSIRRSPCRLCSACGFLSRDESRPQPPRHKLSFERHPIDYACISPSLPSSSLSLPVALLFLSVTPVTSRQHQRSTLPFTVTTALVLKGS
jgi:hypothetical protein